MNDTLVLLFIFLAVLKTCACEHYRLMCCHLDKSSREHVLWCQETKTKKCLQQKSWESAFDSIVVKKNTTCHVLPASAIEYTRGANIRLGLLSEKFLPCQFPIGKMHDLCWLSQMISTVFYRDIAVPKPATGISHPLNLINCFWMNPWGSDCRTLWIQFLTFEKGAVWL